MATNISLNKSVRTCKVNVGWAPRIQSDRFENSDAMMCPVWNGRDLAGRAVCADSFYTKREGCNSSSDRITVENSLRPQYMEYVTLDAAGIDGDMYEGSENVGVTESFRAPRGGARAPQLREGFGVAERSVSNCGASRAKGQQMFYADAVRGCQSLENIQNITGQFGQNNFVADIYPTCGVYPYESAMAQVAAQQRSRQMMNQGGKEQRYRAYSQGGDRMEDAYAGGW